MATVPTNRTGAVKARRSPHRGPRGECLPIVLSSARFMPTDIPLRCVCGKLQGTALAVSPSAGCRVVCYCNDCQAFARFLARPGITDEWGGTDIFQMAP